MPSLTGKRALILIEDHFEDTEVLVPKSWLEDAGVEVHVAGRATRVYKGKKGYEVPADTTIADAAQGSWDLVHVPGGFAPDKLRTYPEVLELVTKQDEAGKPLAAICHAGWVLASADLVRGRRVTSYFAIQDDMKNAGAEWVDERCVVDDNLITSRYPGDLPAYCRALLAALAGERPEGEEGEPHAPERSAQRKEKLKAAKRPGPKGDGRKVTAPSRGR
ncbi:MAG: type 1 glutamine amidotransferase [Halobacteriales archaeon]|nr:type 1 glutamine amidotransferase [Halobacteriales archaeon]